MADNVQITAGSGTTIATDEVVINGVTVQVSRGKAGFGVDGSYIDVSATNPMPVNFTNTTLAVTGTFYQATQPVSLASAPLPTGASTEATLAALSAKITACNTGAVVLGAGELHMGEVGGNSLPVKPTITVTASSAYAAGNVVGGVLTLTNAVRKTNGTGVFQNLELLDFDNQKPLLDIFIFSQNPSNGTYTDKAAISWNATDLGFKIAHVTVTSADWKTVGSVASTILPSIAKVIAATNGSANLYAIMVTSSTPTWTGTGKLAATFGFLRD